MPNQSYGNENMKIRKFMKVILYIFLITGILAFMMSLVFWDDDLGGIFFFLGFVIMLIVASGYFFIQLILKNEKAVFLSKIIIITISLSLLLAFIVKSI